jgi:fumarate reductase subunit D
MSRRARRAASTPAVEWLSRAGIVCRALVYALVAVLVLQVAAGHVDKRADSKGALETVAHQPLGRVMLLAMAVGLAGYALWRFFEAATSQGWGKRLAAVGKGLVYVGLLAFAVRLVAGHRAAGDEHQEVDLTARILKLPLGRAVVLGVGLAVVAVGLSNLYHASGRRYQRHLRTGRLSAREERWIGRVAVVGLLSRMLVFCLVGAFVVRAAVRYDPNEATGLDGALKRLGGQPYGPFLLVLVAAGLFAFAVYCAVEARYRRLFERV